MFFGVFTTDLSLAYINVDSVAHYGYAVRLLDFGKALDLDMYFTEVYNGTMVMEFWPPFLMEFDITGKARKPE